jgi:hypothetical protein
LKQGFTPWELAKLYVSSGIGGLRQRHQFAELEAFCLFIGYPRSGHSLVGSLLDAHPDVIVAHELDVLRFVEARFTSRQLYRLLLANSELAAERGREQTGYTYAVPNQWQGRFETLRVIGDKKGGVSTRRLEAKPDLLQRLRATVGLPIRVIHVVRNPYDNISTMATRPDVAMPEELRGKVVLSAAMDRYFSLCEVVANVSGQLGAGELFHLRHEALGESPVERLRDLCLFLGVQPSEGYLSDCASIVRREQHRSRDEVSWTRESIDSVAKKIERYGFLEGYTFEN